MHSGGEMYYHNIFLFYYSIKMAEFDYTKAEVVKGSDGKFYSQTGMWKNEKREGGAENLFYKGMSVEIDGSKFDPNKKYQFSLWKNTNKEQGDKKPEFQLSITEVTPKGESTDTAPSDDTEDEDDF